MSERKIKIIVCLLLLIISFGVIVSAFIISNNKDDDDAIIDEYNIVSNNYIYSEVYDINQYQTVYNSMINYFINLNQNNILKLLSETYIKNNDITISNVNDFTEEHFENFSYKITDIKKYFNSYYSIFYVEGEYSLEYFDEFLKTNIVKNLVILDIANSTYSVVPLLNENNKFEEIINKYNFQNYDKEIIKNEINEIKYGTLDESSEAMLYFSIFTDLLINNCEKAYNKIGEKTKNIYSNYSDFSSLCNNFNSNNFSPTLKNYDIQYTNEGLKVIKVIDYNSIEYNFFINSITNYYVEITITN